MDSKAIGFILLGIAVLATIVLEVRKRAMYAKIERCFLEQRYGDALELMDRPIVRWMYPPYNQMFMRLNAHIGLEDAESATSVIDEMLGLRMSGEQRLALHAKAFAFFVEAGDKKRAREMIRLIEDAGEDDLARASRETYDIFLKKGYGRIAQMEAELENADAAERVRLCQLLAVQYDNKGDKAESERYLGLAGKAIEEMAE